MSGGAAVAAIPVAGEDTDDALPRSTALRKKSDISKKDEECTCPDACEVHPKAKEPMQKSKEFFNPTKTTVGTV